MKHLIAFLLGAGVGVIGTYVYFNNKIENIIDKKVNEEMENFFKHQTETLSEDDVEEVDEEKEDEPVVSDIPDTTEKTSIVKMEEMVRTNYRDNDGIEEDEDDEEEYITDEEMKELMSTAQNRMAELPQIITEEEQDTTLIGYDNEEYIWFPKENFITDAFDNKLEEQDFLDILFKPIDWRKELKDKNKIIIRVPEEATNYTVWNHDLADWG